MEQLTKAEQKALAATSLPAFPVQLHEIRRTVRSILDQFGRGNIFSEYTVHNFSHIESMLADLEWLIPSSTAEKLTNADWLIIVLSIYFHDLGLIVTEDEFLNRDKSAFDDFCKSVLFVDKDGLDYQNKINNYGHERADRFFYQEFVRHNHAKRIRSWVEGFQASHLGFATAQVAELNRLLSPLDPEFRGDIAIIAESHNLDDLEDATKYKTFKPYGASQNEAANLLYAAAVLRTVDLLQITSQRAPSIMMRLINPRDPISQIEWVKQNCVKGAFAVPVIGPDGIVQPEKQSDTIAIYAKFKNEDGYFGLTSYLKYTQAQLNATFNIVRNSNRSARVALDFPWRFIDISNVEAEGFIPRQFEFNLDQRKILELLTGHTLYNDSAVAIRELVQNSIDAVRLYFFEKGLKPSDHGNVSIKWKPKERVLEILDNGTGMTQDIIEAHLLKVGSSRYQDPKFIEKFPTFFPISRFGIGVLSTFMVADHVQVTTVHEDESQGREISLRSVHGNYLIKLLNKQGYSVTREIGDHGTKISLRLRASIEDLNVIETLKRWILFPPCRVTYQEDDNEVMCVGFKSPAEALRAYIDTSSYFERTKSDIRVIEIKLGEHTLAYAMRYNWHFRDMTFVTVPSRRQLRGHYIEESVGEMPVGICVEGIRVDTEILDVQSKLSYSDPILTILNCTGASSPRTNVARTALESINDRNKLYEQIYMKCLEQALSEITRLQSEENFGVHYSVEQFGIIAGPVINGLHAVLGSIDHIVDGLPTLIFESGSTRQAVSCNWLAEEGEFYTVNSSGFQGVVEILRDAPPEVTCKALAELIALKGGAIPAGGLVTNISYPRTNFSAINRKFEIAKAEASESDRRIDILWKAVKLNRSWISIPDIIYVNRHIIRQVFRNTDLERGRHSGIFLPTQEYDTNGLQNYIGFCLESTDTIYLTFMNDISVYLNKYDTSVEDGIIRSYTVSLILSAGMYEFFGGMLSARKMEEKAREIEITAGSLAPVKETLELMSKYGGAKVFSTSSWNRRNDD
jgi:hypothetical protein